MAKLLMPSGSADFRELAVKLGYTKARTAMLAPYGDAGDVALSAKVGSMGGGGKVATTKTRRVIRLNAAS